MPDAAPPLDPPAPVFSPLHDIHVAAGASFTDFAGWQMPVRYSSDLAEHHAVRTAAAIFDLSHMAELGIRGPEAGALLDHALAGRLSALSLGQAKYSLLLDETGAIIDDVVVYRTGDDEFVVVANAGNHAVAHETLLERSHGFDAAVTDDSDDTALIAVQGPRALEIVEATAGLSPAPDARSLDSLGYYRAQQGSFAGRPVLVARTGYTGEDGFELYVHTADAPALWRALVSAGEPFGLVPAGLAARDSLRLEAGMPLYGHELGLDTLPADAGLGRVPNFGKGDFVGRAALERASGADAPPRRVLVGLVGDGKRAARADYEIFADAESAQPIGVVTSGVLSPTLGVPVAMAYVDPAFAEAATVLSVDVRSKRLPFTVTTLPFYSRPSTSRKRDRS
ncbi:glycine cleavage system aminomethyltransferase GcvT [Subtercola sp. YIM 133946]|uniref:glycine cleavage system aminomethyltransferase GcvT n=1 Tax=Subtercola sp. YIM 133946 TaxID=3118909 RepID=UPI002F92DACE